LFIYSKKLTNIAGKAHKNLFLFAGFLIIYNLCIAKRKTASVVSFGFKTL